MKSLIPAWLRMVIVRLNLINHFVRFIPCQFACNSAFRNPIFRWKSCKGSVWESVKKSSKVCILQGLVTGSREWQVAKRGTSVKHAEKLKSHASCCTTGQKSQVGQTVSSRLELATQYSREAKSLDHFVWEKLTFCIPNWKFNMCITHPWTFRSQIYKLPIQA